MECFVTQFDLIRAYWQIQLCNENREKLSFLFDNQQFQSTRLLYGLHAAPAGFSRIMHKIFGQINDLVLYLDDGLIISGTWEEHISAIRQFLQLCIK